MQIVIKLSDKIYDTILNDEMPTNEQMKVIVQRIYEGIPLDNHGRLIDADELLINERPRDLSWTQWEDMPFYEVISNAPTVIESTKGE